MAKQVEYTFPSEVEIEGKLYKVPKSWNDINIRQYSKLVDISQFDDIKFVAIMLDAPEELVANSSVEDLDLIVYSNVKWYFQQRSESENHLNKKMPKSITIDGAVIEIPKDLKMKSYAQKIAAEQLLDKAKGKNPFMILSEVIAIYLHPEYLKVKFNIDKPVFDLEKALKFNDEFIATMPIVEGYPIGSFFLKKLTASLNKKINILVGSIPEKRKKRIFSFLKNSNSLER